MALERIRDILNTHGKLSADAVNLAPDADLYASGLTSLTTVNVMLALEDTFDVEFSDDMLSRRTFQSIAALQDAIADLLSEHLHAQVC